MILVVPLIFQPLPLGSIKPQGWLLDQMQLEANGLGGHEAEFYRYVVDSSWLGGNQEYSALNEGYVVLPADCVSSLNENSLPYLFNGLVPLAYGLDDSRLKNQVKNITSIVIGRQQSDGWIGPEVGNARNFWARYPLFLGLINLLEADSSFEDTVVPALQRFFILMNTMLKNNGTGYLPQQGDLLSDEDHNWGRIRVCDMMITLMWMYDRYPGNQSQILIENLNMLVDGQIDWASWYQQGAYIFEDLNTVDIGYTTRMFPYEHGVNVAQGLKAGAVINRFTNNSSLAQMARTAVNWTFTYHGAPSGTILADERLDGLAPYYASEFCTAVEAMYSLAYLYQALGDNDFADRCELAAFNAMPAHLTPDWWARTYGTQPNGPYARHLDSVPFWNMNGYGTIYGLEPDYPCCTVDHVQGYPKFTASMFVQVGANGLAHALLAPGSATAILSSGRVTVNCTTNYPFDNTLSYTVSSTAAFDFYTRVPAWANPAASELHMGSSSSPLSPDSHTGLHTISLPGGISTFSLALTPGSAITTQALANDSIAVFSGPILYALEISAAVSSNTPLTYGQTSYPANYLVPQAQDYVMVNTTPWNIAIDPSTLSQRSNSTNATLPNPIWSPGAPPTWMTALGCEIDWPLYNDVPDAVPPLASRKCIGRVTNVTLRPYGSQKLHMSVLPTIDLSGHLS